MSSLKYGDDNGPGDKLSDTYHYSQFVHLPHGVTKVSGQGGWDLDGNIDADDWRGQIERAFDNLDRVLKVAGLSGLDDIYLIRSYVTNVPKHFPFLTETMKKRLKHRPIYTALSVPELGAPEMVIEIEVEAFRK